LGLRQGDFPPLGHPGHYDPEGGHYLCGLEIAEMGDRRLGRSAGADNVRQVSAIQTHGHEKTSQAGQHRPAGGRQGAAPALHFDPPVAGELVKIDDDQVTGPQTGGLGGQMPVQQNDKGPAAQEDLPVWQAVDPIQDIVVFGCFHDIGLVGALRMAQYSLKHSKHGLCHGKGACQRIRPADPKRQ
jgi:hypothetical protein